MRSRTSERPDPDNSVYGKPVLVYGIRMTEKAKRGRPPTGEAKEAVTLRLRPIVLAAYRAMGDDWRGQMERAIIAGLAPKATARAVLAKAERTKPLKIEPVPRSKTVWPSGVLTEPHHTEDPGIEAPRVTVAVPLYQRKAFNPQQKKGTKK